MGAEGSPLWFERSSGNVVTRKAFGRTPKRGQKGVGTFSGVRYFLLGSVRHRLQRAPEEDPVNAGPCAHFQVWGTRGRVFESLRPYHIS